MGVADEVRYREVISCRPLMGAGKKVVLGERQVLRVVWVGGIM